jgi:lipopolysaccharide export system protein LptA
MNRANAYTNLTAVGKKICTLLLFISIAAVMLPFSDISFSNKKSQIVSQNENVEQTIEEFVVKDPQFNMIDAEKNKYHVVADKAQEQKNEILLQAPKTSVYFLNNSKLKILAKYGTWYQIPKILKIKQNVSINYDDNYYANTNSMALDVANNVIYSHQHIVVDSTVANLNASAFKSDNVAQKIYFSGPIKVIVKKTKGNEEATVISEKLMVDQQQNTATFTGKVVLRQTNSVTKADKMIFYYVPESKEINKIQTFGNVYIIKDTQIAKADQGEYLVKEKTIELVGGVSLKNDDNIIKGDRLIYNTITGMGKIIPTLNSDNSQVKAILKE